MASIVSAGTTSGTALNMSGDTSGVLQLASNNGTVGVTLDTSQNVGIGTTSPSALAEVYKSSTSNPSIFYVTNPSTSGTFAASQMALKSYNGSSVTEGLILSSISNSWSYGNTFANSAQVYSGLTNGLALISENASGFVRFLTGSTASERMRIDSSGNLLIGYTSSNGSYKLQVNSQIFATSSTIATSDARYKENVEELSGALDIVKALRPVSFDWKAHPVHNFDTKTKTVGFLAQDVQQALAGKPYLNSIIKTNECVIEPEVKDEEGNVTKQAVTEEFLGIAEGNMISILTAAIKELKAEFDEYKATHP